MGKLLFFGLLALLVYLLLKKGQGASRTAAPPKVAEDMVRCARCGVHLPRSESILSGGEFYCCEQHRAEGKS
ncbi:MAG: PP0621 family protein [Sulfuricellaceae bacterium]